MTEFRDLSSLPEDPGYWQGLEERIMGELGPRVPEAAATRTGGWWAPLAARAWGLGGLAAAAALAALLLLPPRPEATAPDPLLLLSAPTGDPALAAFIASPAPPAIGSLVVPPRGRNPDD